MAIAKRKRKKAKINFSDVKGLYRDDAENVFLKVDNGGIVIAYDMVREIEVTTPADTDKVISCNLIRFVYEDNLDDSD